MYDLSKKGLHFYSYLLKKKRLWYIIGGSAQDNFKTQPWVLMATLSNVPNLPAALNQTRVASTRLGVCSLKRRHFLKYHRHICDHRIHKQALCDSQNMVVLRHDQTYRKQAKHICYSLITWWTGSQAQDKGGSRGSEKEGGSRGVDCLLDKPLSNHSQVGIGWAPLSKHRMDDRSCTLSAAESYLKLYLDKNEKN